jgi:uncharacterized protein (TIGR02246 family)
MRTVKEVLDRHVAAFGGGNLDEVMADYADEAVAISSRGNVVVGKEAIRAAFAPFMTGALGGMEVQVESIHGEIAFTVWKAAITPFGTDTFVIKDGQIVAHTISLYMGED